MDITTTGFLPLGGACGEEDLEEAKDVVTSLPSDYVGFDRLRVLLHELLQRVLSPHERVIGAIFNTRNYVPVDQLVHYERRVLQHTSEDECTHRNRRYRRPST